MDVFGLRDRLIEDYRDFTGSFVDIHDKSIADHVRDRNEADKKESCLLTEDNDVAMTEVQPPWHRISGIRQPQSENSGA